MLRDRYFQLYKLVLKIVSDKNPSNANELIQYMQTEDLITSILKSGISGTNLGKEVIQILQNLIDDELIKGNYTMTKDGTLYLIQGLTTNGYTFLEQSKKSKFKDKLFNILKNDGLPLTASSLSKAFFKLIL